MEIATLLAKRQRVIDAVDEAGIVDVLRVSERTSINDDLSSYELQCRSTSLMT